jgi:hypothetical protein
MLGCWCLLKVLKRFRTRLINKKLYQWTGFSMIFTYYYPLEFNVAISYCKWPASRWGSYEHGNPWWRIIFPLHIPYGYWITPLWQPLAAHTRKAFSKWPCGIDPHWWWASLSSTDQPEVSKANVKSFKYSCVLMRFACITDWHVSEISGVHAGPGPWCLALLWLPWLSEPVWYSPVPKVTPGVDARSWCFQLPMISQAASQGSASQDGQWEKKLNNFSNHQGFVFAPNASKGVGRSSASRVIESLYIVPDLPPNHWTRI